MSSCLSGGGRAYRIQPLDLDIIKSPSSTTSWISNHSSSPSSTLSESRNCPLAISTRKPRTPRKRPKQTYNEAAAILSTAYPKIFPTKPSRKFTKSHDHLFEQSDLLMPFDKSASLDPRLLQRPSNFEPKLFNLNSCQSPGEINSSEICYDSQQEFGFDADSMLDEEMGEGIESVMGNLGMENESIEDTNLGYNQTSMHFSNNTNFCYGYPVVLGFEFGYGKRREMRAIRSGGECDWWKFPSVNLVDITPKIARVSAEKNNNNKLEEIKSEESGDSVTNPKSTKQNLRVELPVIAEECIAHPNPGLNLKLNYDGVLDEWSDKGFPFSGDSPASPSVGNDVQGRLARIDLFSGEDGIRETSMMRYKEKRRTRLFSRKIRYEVHKVNADQRPRLKGRFVRTPNSSDE